MTNNTYPFIFHGSSDSLDIDVHLVVPEILPRERAKQICDECDIGNANMIFVEDGKVAWSYKGSPDECNNGILATYGFHKQIHENPVKHKVDRNVAVKIVKTIRGILGMYSRTESRLLVKEALRSTDLAFKLNVISHVVHTHGTYFGLSRNSMETEKFLAFHVAQCFLLMQGTEVYTKQEVNRHIPSLAAHINREPKDDYDHDQLIDYIIAFVLRVFAKTRQEENKVIFVDDGSAADIKLESSI